MVLGVLCPVCGSRRLEARNIVYKPVNPAGDRGARLEHFLAPPVHPWRRRRALLERRARGTRAGEAEGVNRWKCVGGVLEEVRVFSEILQVLGCS